jgi:threonine aldolase
MIDLRSDTVTKPSPAMLEAMINAPLGDDVFGEDPSILSLEDKVAGLFGKEAALFCPSGTMANQIAIKILTNPGEELICDENSHIYQYEGGGIAFHSGVQVKLLQGDAGRISAEQVAGAIQPEADWLPRTSLVCLENTVNKAGGSVYTFAQMESISTLCRNKSLALHMDGARIFNALLVSGDAPEKVGSLFDTLSVCFSKGLGAPVGSALLGSKQEIKKARKVRKLFGGGMRQAGILAAAGIFALDHNISRLTEDHRHAAMLAEAAMACRHTENVLPVQTNIVIFSLKPEIPASVCIEKLKSLGILCVGFGGNRIRLVTHMDVGKEKIEEACHVLSRLSC